MTALTVAGLTLREAFRRKVIWALLDLVTIAVLVSGLYLWLRRRSPVEARIAELEGLASSR